MEAQTPAEAQRRVEKRKANEQSAGEAVKAMRLDEMIAFVNEVSAHMESLHVAEPQIDKKILAKYYDRRARNEANQEEEKQPEAAAGAAQNQQTAGGQKLITTK